MRLLIDEMTASIISKHGARSTPTTPAPTPAPQHPRLVASLGDEPVLFGAILALHVRVDCAVGVFSQRDAAGRDASDANERDGADGSVNGGLWATHEPLNRLSRVFLG
jgi:hypothetical protein